eukprot:1659644-Prymnesium_polylepis.1
MSSVLSAVSSRLGSSRWTLLPRKDVGPDSRRQTHDDQNKQGQRRRRLSPERGLGVSPRAQATRIHRGARSTPLVTRLGRARRWWPTP